MKSKKEPITHEQAINEFYGGVLKLAESPFPWKCKCKGGKAYSMRELFEHVTEGHGEKLKS